MRGENESKSTGRAFSRERTHFAFAARTLVAALVELGMARAEALMLAQSSRREAHHEKRGQTLSRCSGDWWGSSCHEELPEMLFMESHCIAGTIPVVGFGDQIAADGYLRRKTDNRDPDAVCNERSNGLVDVAGIRGDQGRRDDEDFAGAVRRCIASHKISY